MSTISKIYMRSGSFKYAQKTVPFSYWVHADDASPPIAVVFLGTGQVGKVPYWVAEQSPAGTVVVEGLPHWLSSPDGKDIEAFSHAYTRAAYLAILNDLNVQRLHIIGDSQACPSTVWLANNVPVNVGNVVLIMPMGLNTKYFGANPGQRFNELRKRSLATMLQPEQAAYRDLRNIYIASQLLKIITQGVHDGSTKAKYSIGISQDRRAELKVLLETRQKYKRSVTILLGEKDKIFPPTEVIPSIADAGIKQVDIEIMAGVSHSSLAVRSSRSLLNRATDIVRT